MNVLKQSQNNVRVSPDPILTIPEARGHDHRQREPRRIEQTPPKTGGIFEEPVRETSPF